MKKGKGNVLIVHGGGLVDASKLVILFIARWLYKLATYGTIYIGKYSFMSFYDPELYFEYNEKLERFLKNKRGTFFGTCRGIDMTKPDILAKAIKTLKEANISTVIVCGGDGSARNCAEINEEFQRKGINIIFAVPLTVDGINGGCSIGLDQAARECERQIENVVATSLETRDNGKFSVVGVEVQGRNRDDILATVTHHFDMKGKVGDCPISDILLRVVPANYSNRTKKLMEEISSSDKRTLVLFSEGAKLKVNRLQKHTNRKVRTVVVGHAVQSNGLTNKKDMESYSDWLSDVVNIIEANPYESYCIVNDGARRFAKPIDYYKILNPRVAQKAVLPSDLEKVLKKYMA